MTYEDWLSYTANNSLSGKSSDAHLWSQLSGKIDDESLCKIVINVTQTKV